MADRSILVVDDNEINRGILGEIFKDKYNILEAGNGLEAIKMMEQYEDKLAAILLDIVMPDMDGYAVLDEMTKRDNLNESTGSTGTMPRTCSLSHAVGPEAQPWQKLWRSPT